VPKTTTNTNHINTNQPERRNHDCYRRSWLGALLHHETSRSWTSAVEKKPSLLWEERNQDLHRRWRSKHSTRNITNLDTSRRKIINKHGCLRIFLVYFYKHTSKHSQL
jgi:hypothetical protein